MATAGDARGPGPERAYAPELPDSGAVTLDADESAHLVRSRRVLVRPRRVRAGAPVVLFDGRGTTRLGRLTTADPRAAVVALEGPYPARVPACRIRMAVSLPEAGRADRLVSTLAELGVSDFAPLACARTPPNRSDLGARRADRWQRLAREAAKVNGCGVLLVLHPLVAFAAALRVPAVLLDPDPGAPPLRDVFDEAAAPWILVGPEGGFTDAEVAGARAAGVPTARVGALALRTATASTVAAALLSL